MTRITVNSETRDDLRRNRRHQVKTKARIDLNDGTPLLECQLINLSGGGAQLTVPNSAGLPDFFSLVLSHDGGLRRQCSVVWRSKTSIGVEFVPLDPSRPVDE